MPLYGKDVILYGKDSPFMVLTWNPLTTSIFYDKPRQYLVISHVVKSSYDQELVQGLVFGEKLYQEKLNS